MKIRVIDLTKKLSPNFTRRLKSCLRVVAERELKVKELNVILVTDSYIRKLNKTFLGKDKPTDVLSFGLDNLGEIYISVDTARRNARKYGFTAEFEIWRYALHGLLHIAGYDHKDKSQEKAMEASEEKYLSLWENC